MKKIIFTLLVSFLSAYNLFAKQWIIVYAKEGSIIPFSSQHAFATFIQEDAKTKTPKLIGAWGFAPIKSNHPFGEGKIHDEINTPKYNSFVLEVTDIKEWNACMFTVVKWNKKYYSLTWTNCVRFIREILANVKIIQVPPIEYQLPIEFVEMLKSLNSVWEEHSILSYDFSINNHSNVSATTTSLKINPKDVTLPTDKEFKWYKWDNAPSFLKVAVNQIIDTYGKPFSETINFYLNEGYEVDIAAIDLDDNGVAGIVFKTAGKCLGGVMGCRFGLWENGGTQTGQLWFLKYGEAKPSKNGIVDGKGDFDPLIENNAITAEKKAALLSLFKYSKDEPQVSSKPNANLQLLGATTPDELGRLIFKALKTNDKKLFSSCIHPQPYKNDRARIEADFDRLREEFAEQGLNNWNSAKYSRVTFMKEIPGFSDLDGGQRNGEQVRRSFTIEFTFNNQEFMGRMEGAVIVTFQNKFYIWNGGFATRSFRL